MSFVRRIKVSFSINEKQIEKIITSIKERYSNSEVLYDKKTNCFVIKSDELIKEETYKAIINDIILNEKEKVIELYFEGIDCPSCASKVEGLFNNLEVIKSAKINFLNKKILIILNKEVDDLIHILEKEARKIEASAKIFNKGNVKNLEIHDHDCSCHDHIHHHNEHEDCGHNHDNCSCSSNHHEKKEINGPLIILVIGLLLASFATILQFSNNLFIVRTVCFIVAYLCIANKLLINAFNNVKNKDFFNENTLMVIASVGALCIDEGFEGIMVILLNRIGEYFQNKATEKSKKAIENMIELEVDQATNKDGKIINVKDIKIGEVLVIKAGEKIPLDGVLLSNEAILDMKSLSGESKSVSLRKGEEILSGSINTSKVIEIEVTKKYEESTIAKVKKLIDEANNKKSKSQEFIGKFAKVYTPIIILFAIVIGLVQAFALNKNLEYVLNSVFSILVIACPCALVISIPLCYFSAIGRSSSEGILVKGGNYLDVLYETKTFVFDKTGTITKGNFKVTEINSNSISNEELLEIVSKVEVFSTHPIAMSIKQEYGKEIETLNDVELEEIAGEGIKMIHKKDIYLVGNEKIMNRFNVKYEKNSSVGSIVYASKNGQYLGNIVVKDEVKEGVKELISTLNKFATTYLLTGDKKEVGEEVASLVRINNVYTELLPDDKYEIINSLIKSNKNKICYVGDGINDAPSLALSDVGVCLGGIGSDSSKECADIVIMSDDVTKIMDALKISKLTRTILIQNIVFILLIKLLAIIIGATGILGPYAMFVSIFSDVGVCLLSILNTLRILKK